jgi:hypothetical protein
MLQLDIVSVGNDDVFPSVAVDVSQPESGGNVPGRSGLPVGCGGIGEGLGLDTNTGKKTGHYQKYNLCFHDAVIYKFILRI